VFDVEIDVELGQALVNELPTMIFLDKFLHLSCSYYRQMLRLDPFGKVVDVD